MHPCTALLQVQLPGELGSAGAPGTRVADSPQQWFGICSAAHKWPRPIPDRRFPGHEADFSPRGFCGANRGSPSQGRHSKLRDPPAGSGHPSWSPSPTWRPWADPGLRKETQFRLCQPALQSHCHSPPRSGPEPRLPLVLGGFHVLRVFTASMFPPSFLHVGSRVAPCLRSLCQVDCKT